MARTTPPRPVDIAAIFPELREHTGSATRLHPRAGAPTVSDSSIGGPLLWPADEPWPACEDGEHYLATLVRTEDVRRERAILGAAWARTRRGESMVVGESALPES